MSTARHSATVTKGQVIFADPVGWRANVSKHEGRQVFVSIVRQSQARTLPQNRLYWLWVGMVADHIGEDEQSVHEELKARFLQRRVVELLDGKTMELPPSTKRLQTTEMTVYLDKVSAWAASFLGLYLPSGDQMQEGL